MVVLLTLLFCSGTFWFAEETTGLEALCGHPNAVMSVWLETGNNSYTSTRYDISPGCRTIGCAANVVYESVLFVVTVVMEIICEGVPRDGNPPWVVWVYVNVRRNAAKNCTSMLDPQDDYYKVFTNTRTSQGLC